MNEKNNTLDIPFRTIAHFYDSDDPSPEDDRELSDRAEDQIYHAISEYTGKKGRLKDISLRIILPAADWTEKRQQDLPKALKSHFYRRQEELMKDAAFTVREGLREFRLTIGVCFFLFTGIAVTARFPHEPFAVLAMNVFVIFSWVVIWQPFQTLVFDRWSLHEQARTYREITRLRVDVIPS